MNSSPTTRFGFHSPTFTDDIIATHHHHAMLPCRHAEHNDDDHQGLPALVAAALILAFDSWMVRVLWIVVSCIASITTPLFVNRLECESLAVTVGVTARDSSDECK